VVEVSQERFQELINLALEELPGEHVKSIKNIAILFEDVPTPEQRQKLALRHDQTLLGLYEGVPLPQRQGTTKIYPDKITLFRVPLQWQAADEDQLKEIAHYYGLDHDKIRDLE
jgi:predicted Zn-dependent protease with MMP-like domain